MQKTYVAVVAVINHKINQIVSIYTDGIEAALLFTLLSQQKIKEENIKNGLIAIKGALFTNEDFEYEICKDSEKEVLKGIKAFEEGVKEIRKIYQH